jgi:hypothetical protein
MSNDAALREQLIDLLNGGNAHITFGGAVKDFPVKLAGIRPPGSPHSAWEILEHLRLAQRDIVSFCEGEDYVELKWPDDYWPSSLAPKNASEWKKSVDAVHADRNHFLRFLQDEKRDLFEPFSWGDGQTLLHEALLIADHNAYHLGQLMLIHRMLDKT